MFRTRAIHFCYSQLLECGRVRVFACSSVLVEKNSVFQSHAAVGLLNKNDIEKFRAHVLATLETSSNGSCSA